MFIFASLPRKAAHVEVELIQMRESKINKYKPNFQNEKRQCSLKLLVIPIVRFNLVETKSG
jgi:hypothetical protein